MTMCELREKEVINVNDGCRLGFVCDICFSSDTGAIETLVVPGPAKLLGLFGRETEYRIPWDDVTRIGDDVVLIDVEVKKCVANCE